jgi:outer membrane protein TolC
MAEQTAPSMPGVAPMLHGKLELSLADAIQMGLENNLSVQVSRYGPLIAGYDEGVAWGAYDPELFAELGHADSEQPSANTLQTGTPRGGVLGTTQTDGLVGFRGLVPWLGADYNVRFDTSDTSTTSGFNSLSPEFNSSITLGASVPLLRDLIWNQPWTQVKTTRILHESSREDFRRSVMDTVRDIEDAYWLLIAAEERVRVAHKSLETARALLDQTQTQFEVGVVSKVEVIEAEAGVSQREFNVIVTTNDYRNQQDVLIDLVLGPGLRAASTLEIEPKDRPDEFIAYTIDVEQAVQMAFENRPELAAAHKQIERDTININLQFAKNQRLPGLDLQGSYRIDGLSGFANPVDNPFTGPNDVDLGPWEDSIRRDGESWTIRGLFSIPVPNRAARRTVSKTELELRRSETQLRQGEQRIILEVRKAARDLKAAQEGIEAADTARKAAAEQLRAEKIRLEYGESTPFSVLQREEDFVDRETELISAFRVYRSSATNLDRAQGTILRNRNIKIDQVSALR